MDPVSDALRAVRLTGAYFYLVEAADLAEATRIAAGIPPARVGSIEVRPIRPLRDMVRERREAEEGGR